MASQPTNSSLADRYAQMSRISEMLDSLIGLDTATPSGTFTTGPNRGLPVAAMPPSATPFRQKSGPRRVSKVTAETARARADREARPAKQAERFARNAPKPPALLARADQTSSGPSQLYGDPPMFPRGMTPEQLEKYMQESRGRLSKSDTSPPKQPRPGPRPAPYSTRGVGEKMAAPVGRPETKAAPRRQPIGPSALSTTLSRIDATPASSIYRSAPGLTAEDFRQAQETMDLGQTQRAFDIGYATQARQLADEDIARTQAGYAAGDEAFRQRMAELDADAYAKHMAAQRAGRRAATATGRASQAADAMGNQYYFDPLAAFGRAMGFGQ